MSYETPAEQAEKHPGDAFFEKLGLPEGFGETERTYHGRTIQLRDYFLQPDVDPGARRAYETLSVMDPADPNFPMFRDAFVSAAQQYLGVE